MSATRSLTITHVGEHGPEERSDVVAIEEPLEIRLGLSRRGRPVQKSVSITMRTPGHDFELAAGFLFSEAILRDPAQIDEIRYCGGEDGRADNTNVVRVELAPHVEVDLMRLQRHFYTTSSCGVCGKTSLEALDVTGCEPLTIDDWRVRAQTLYALPQALGEAQAIFESTGGIHASGLFCADGSLLEVREDVGRHNAMDKLVGAHFLRGETPLRETILMLSGRASFELLQKALMARIPVVAAIGAPSSLAVDLARQFGITLCGFVRNTRFNVYTHPQRILVDL